MDKKKEEKEAYATEDPTDTSAKEQEDMAKRPSRNSNLCKNLNFH